MGTKRLAPHLVWCFAYIPQNFSKSHSLYVRDELGIYLGMSHNLHVRSEFGVPGIQGGWSEVFKVLEHIWEGA